VLAICLLFGTVSIVVLLSLLGLLLLLLLLFVPVDLALGTLGLLLLGLVAECHIRNLGALLEVDGLCDVERAGHLGVGPGAQLGGVDGVNGIGCLALALHVCLRDCEAFGEQVLCQLLLSIPLLILLVVLFPVLLVLLLAQSLGIVLLQVQLDHLEHTPFDVLGPGVVVLVKLDTFNDALGIVELAAKVQLALLLRWDLLLQWNE
jgi:hypothetical protein